MVFPYPNYKFKSRLQFSLEEKLLVSFTVLAFCEWVCCKQIVPCSFRVVADDVGQDKMKKAQKVQDVQQIKALG